MTWVFKDDIAVLTLLFTNLKELMKALGKLKIPIFALHAINVEVIKELTFKSVSIVKKVLIWPKLLIVLMRAVLAMKLFVEIPGKKLKVLACDKNVLRVLTPWPKFIVLAPIDKAVLILLKGIGMMSCKELSADIVVLNEEVPRELNCVMEDILKRRSPFITYRAVLPILKVIELVLNELVVRRPVLTVEAKVELLELFVGSIKREVPKRVLAFIEPAILIL